MSTSKFITYWFLALKKIVYCLFYNNLDSGYDYGSSDDESVVDSDDYIKNL